MEIELIGEDQKKNHFLSENGLKDFINYLDETREKLMHREKELMDERQRAEVERQQHAAAQQALITRLSSLEMGMPGTRQSHEASKVRLAPWMSLKK